MKKFDDSTINEAKMLFLERGMTFHDISKFFGGSPTTQTVSNWANKKDRHGKTWLEYKEERTEQQYIQMSPGSMAGKILEQIWDALNKPLEDRAKNADQLVKLQASLEKIANVDNQIPVMYHMLQDYILFSKTHYASIVTDDFLESIRAYKNHVRSRLTHDYSPNLAKYMDQNES